MATHASFRFALLATLVALSSAVSTKITSSAGSLRRLGQKTVPPSGLEPTDPLETPNLTGYEPEEVLCMRKDKMQGWCKDWLMCIKKEASPEGTKDAVMKAWKPADCEQMCGKWPVTNKAEGTFLVQESKMNATATAVSSLFHLSAKSSTKDCMTSCANFQDSLAGCVAMIIFEPGKTASMGMPKDTIVKKPEPVCTMKDSPCKPTLEVEHQKCIGHKTKIILGDKKAKKLADDPVMMRCTKLSSDYKECKEAQCPQMDAQYVSVYASYTGGCMDQLNAYHAATNPDAGVAAIPGASGCTVH
mmetsp:Transcript_98173/g.184625  ORF Transcript_98173/g.184625 Transcript_98173/m.184625 type:complete len:302 (-) Transcript_98173:65-970(-)